MNKKLLTAVSALALLGFVPAHAETGVTAQTNTSASAERTAEQNETPTITQEDIKKGWENTKEGVSEAADDVSQATKETYEDIKATMFRNENNTLKMQNVTINARQTASALIDQPVYNADERVGKISDVILDQNGRAMMVVVADGDFFGTGKLAAFDYGSMVKTDAQGNVVMPLTEEMIDQAAEFSYDQEDSGSGVRVIPANGYSVAEILDGDLVNPQGEVLANIDDIQFSQGKASNLVVGFDELLGIGGKKAAMTYSSANVVKDGDDLNVQLSAAQASQFESYKKTISN